MTFTTDAIPACGIPETSHTISDLRPATLHLWSVKANCDESRTSSFASNVLTTTANASSVGTVTADDLIVFASGNVLNIINDKRIAIDRIALYSVTGALIADIRAGADDNLFVPLAAGNSVILVRIWTGDTAQTYKVITE